MRPHLIILLVFIIHNSYFFIKLGSILSCMIFLFWPKMHIIFLLINCLVNKDILLVVGQLIHRVIIILLIEFYIANSIIENHLWLAEWLLFVFILLFRFEMVPLISQLKMTPPQILYHIFLILFIFNYRPVFLRTCLEPFVCADKIIFRSS